MTDIQELLKEMREGRKSKFVNIKALYDYINSLLDYIEELEGDKMYLQESLANLHEVLCKPKSDT